MTARIPTGTTPAQLKTLAVARYEQSTGRRWSKAGHAERERFLAKVEPQLRSEEGIAPDAVWRDGSWHAADQIDLFTTNPEGEVA